MTASSAALAFPSEGIPPFEGELRKVVDHWLRVIHGIAEEGLPEISLLAGSAGAGKNVGIKAVLRVYSKKDKMKHIEVSAILDWVCTLETDLAKVVRPQREKQKQEGGLVDTSLVLEAVFTWLVKVLLENQYEKIIIDGLPRDLAQASCVKFLMSIDFIQRVIFIDCPPEKCEENILRRAQEMLASGGDPRPDDLNPKAVRKRLEIFEGVRKILDMLEAEEENSLRFIRVKSEDFEKAAAIVKALEFELDVEQNMLDLFQMLQARGINIVDFVDGKVNAGGMPHGT